MTLTYDLHRKKIINLDLGGSSSVFLVNCKVISEETTKIEILLKIWKISEFLVKRSFDPRYPKREAQNRTFLAMCPSKMKLIQWIFYQFCWINHVFKHNTYATFVTLTFEIGQNKKWWLLDALITYVPCEYEHDEQELSKIEVNFDNFRDLDLWPWPNFFSSISI